MPIRQTWTHHGHGAKIVGFHLLACLIHRWHGEKGCEGCNPGIIHQNGNIPACLSGGYVLGMGNIELDGLKTRIGGLDQPLTADIDLARPCLQKRLRLDEGFAQSAIATGHQNHRIVDIHSQGPFRSDLSRSLIAMFE